MPQPASRRAPCTVQVRGRNTLPARARPSTRHVWPHSGALLARASTWGKPHYRILRFVTSLAFLPSTLLKPSIASCTLLVSSNMGPTGFGLSFNLTLGGNGVNASSLTLSSWPRSFATSLQTWEILGVTGKDGKLSSLASLLFGSVL